MGESIFPSNHFLRRSPTGSPHPDTQVSHERTHPPPHFSEVSLANHGMWREALGTRSREADPPLSHSPSPWRLIAPPSLRPLRAPGSPQGGKGANPVPSASLAGGDDAILTHTLLARSRTRPYAAY